MFVWGLFKLEGSVDFFFQVKTFPITGRLSRKHLFYMSGPDFVFAVMGSLHGHSMRVSAPITVHLNHKGGQQLEAEGWPGMSQGPGRNKHPKKHNLSHRPIYLVFTNSRN